MIHHALIEWISVTMVAWLRDPISLQETSDWSPRNIRDTILRMIPDQRIPPMIIMRIANQLTRWMMNDDGYFRVRFQSDAASRSAIQRIVVDASEKEGAENDDDITSDELAVTFPRILEWIQAASADMRDFTKEQKKMGRRPKAAREMLLEHVKHSIDGATEEAF